MDKTELILEGIAHDLKNILTGIIANVDLAKICIHPETEIFEILTVIEKNTFRAHKLSEHLNVIAQGKNITKKRFCIATLIEEITDFVLSDRSNIMLDISVPEMVWDIEIDETRVGEVFENLLINAKEAMPEGGTIYLRLGNTILSGSTSLLPPGKYVKIVIMDEGVGIPKEDLPQIFDPNFSTKKRGSGLGLANSYCIIKNNNGFITVDSEIGIGTTFNIYFPAYELK